MDQNPLIPVGPDRLVTGAFAPWEHLLYIRHLCPLHILDLKIKFQVSPFLEITLSLAKPFHEFTAHNHVHGTTEVRGG
jgi:hypothetical protein